MPEITEIVEETENLTVEEPLIFECRVCSKPMKSEETALRLKIDPKDPADDAPRYSFCEACVEANETLLEQQTFHSRMLVSRLLNTMTKEDQEEFRLELQSTDPKQYTIYANLFGHARTMEILDDSGNVVERYENI
jgi:hypothetical protein